jgi:hypothetical protein
VYFLISCWPFNRLKRQLWTNIRLAYHWSLTALHATERGKPRDRDWTERKLLADLPITSRRQATEKPNWYAQRRKIETFHNILKISCRAKQSKQRTAERLVNLLVIFCILSWRTSRCRRSIDLLAI